MKLYIITFLLIISRFSIAQQPDTIQVLQTQLQLLDSIQNSITVQTKSLHERLEALERHQLNQKSADTLSSFPNGKPVIIEGDTLFSLHYGEGMLSLTERIDMISERIYHLSQNESFSLDSLTVVDQEKNQSIQYSETTLMTIHAQDAAVYELTTAELANQHFLIIEKSLEEYFKSYNNQTLLFKIGKVILVLAIMLIIIKLNKLAFSFLKKKAFAQKGKLFNGISIKDFELINPGRQVSIVFFILNALRIIIWAIILYLAIPIVLQIFTFTRGWSDTLFGYVIDPLKAAGLGILNFIPNLFAIIIIFLLTRYFVKFIGAIFAEIAKGKLNVDGFHPEWIKPTYNILRIIIYAFMFILIFPYLPGSDSPVFQGVSVFFGLLLSLGSTSAISNLVAGLVITYMRPFQIGDRVQIGDVMGEVTEKNLLVTRLRTTKNEDVTVPNSNILNTKNMNFSTSSESLGLILHTEVTIGYDVSWKQVHELLINAAKKTSDVLKDKAPFVLQTNLSDFYVAYELNAYTSQPKKMAKIYSDLHQHIQDEFNKAGIEILSPHYELNKMDV